MYPGFPQNQNPRQVSGKETSLAIRTAAEVPPIGSGWGKHTTLLPLEQDPKRYKNNSQ